VVEVEVALEVQPALARLERGDLRGARADLEALLAANPSPDVATAAREILARMAVDPWAIRFGLGALALLVFITLRYIF
jgi:hypothetical protein